MPLHFTCLKFNELSLQQLYDILALRCEVFVVEQNCPFQDPDHKDQRAWHCLDTDNSGKLVAYTRLFAQNDYYEGHCSIGRVITSPLVRRTGAGRALMAYSIDQCSRLFGPVPTMIGAQKYLESFYSSFGFVSTNEDYIEDDILHTIMIKAK